MAQNLTEFTNRENYFGSDRSSTNKRMSSKDGQPVLKKRKTARGLSKCNSLPLCTNSNENLGNDDLTLGKGDGVKQAPKLRTARGMMNKANTYPSPKKNAPSMFKTSSVYSTKVAESMRAFSHQQLGMRISDGEEDEEELKELFTTRDKKKTKSRRRKQSTESETEDMVMLDSDRDSPDISIAKVEEASTSFMRDKSPTPPPSPSASQALRRRAKRTPKGLKSAYKKLNEAKKIQLCLDEDDDCIVLDDPVTPSSSQDTNRDIPVKVRSRSGIQRFPMKKNQLFGSVMAEMASHEVVAENRIVFVFEDVTIQPYDTPESLGVGVADIIECHIRKLDHMSQPPATYEDGDDGLEDPSLIRLRIQGKDGLKSRVEMNVRKTEPLDKLMRQFAYKNKLDLSKLRFEFDGEEISGTDTPDDIDLEDDFCIDVIGA